jgi:hypothetical protein
MKAYKPIPNKKYRVIKSKNLPVVIECLYALNDGRLAIGGRNKLVIYNMKAYKVDIQIERKNYGYVEFITQLNDGNIFYYEHARSTEGQWEDDYHYNYLVELSENDYSDKNDILTKDSLYNILKQNSDDIIFGGINYKIKKENFYTTNASVSKRIEKLVKNDEKYSMVACLNKNFIDFVLLKNNKMALLSKDKLEFYEIEAFKTCEQSVKFNSEPEVLSVFDDNFLLIGIENKVEIFDYKNYKKVKSIFIPYNVKVIKVNQNKVYIACECDIANEYEIDNNGNYNQISSIPLQDEIIEDIAVVKNGRLITCTTKIKMWS